MSADDARRRFDAATRTHLYARLPHGVEARACTAAEWKAHSDPWWNANPRPGIDTAPLLTDEQRQHVADLDAIRGDRLSHHVLLSAGGEVIGAYWGEQEDLGRYYMVNTIMRPDWRGRGVYRAFLAHVEDTARAAGFREMYSRHGADNNAVLVPKLRAGWVIAAFEVSPRWGLLVHLRRYLVDGLARIHQYRVDGNAAAALREGGVKIP